MFTKKQLFEFLGKFTVVFWIAAMLIYLIGGPQFHKKSEVTEAYSPRWYIDELCDDITLSQEVQITSDSVTGIELLLTNYGRSSSGIMNIRLVSDAGGTVATARLQLSDVQDVAYNYVEFDEPLEGYRGQTFTMELSAEDTVAGQGVSAYYGDSYDTGRVEIIQEVPEAQRYVLRDSTGWEYRGTGKTCYHLIGFNYLKDYKTFWIVITGVFLLAALSFLAEINGAVNGKKNLVFIVCSIVTKYRFLLKQLVTRDFKTKYKRSVLGVAWSFLNPLMTMGVQYLVFSTLFKTSSGNYPVYLLSGLVFFNFFSESASLGMQSVVGNASLIKKVYIPIYIFPLSRLLSSLINFGFSLIPLLGVVLITGVPIRPSFVLLIFDVVCLMMFSYGMILILSTLMTFFQDTQYIWGVISLMLMYLTPLFYTDSIIPKEYLALYRVNPLYQFISFARTCIIDGVSPSLGAYWWCLGSGVLFMTLGIWVFQRNQQKFVLYM